MDINELKDNPYFFGADRPVTKLAYALHSVGGSLFRGDPRASEHEFNIALKRHSENLTMTVPDHIRAVGEIFARAADSREVDPDLQREFGWIIEFLGDVQEAATWLLAESNHALKRESENGDAR